MTLIVDSADVIPGLLPDGTPMGKFVVDTANMGTLEWMMSPRQARSVASILEGYASAYLVPYKKRKRISR